MVNRRLIALFVLIVSVCNSSALAQLETRSSNTAQQSPASIAISDFNRDGRLDMAVASYPQTTGDIGIFLETAMGPSVHRFIIRVA